MVESKGTAPHGGLMATQHGCLPPEGLRPPRVYSRFNRYNLSLFHVSRGAFPPAIREKIIKQTCAPGSLPGGHKGRAFATTYPSVGGTSSSIRCTLFVTVTRVFFARRAREAPSTCGTRSLLDAESEIYPNSSSHRLAERSQLRRWLCN